MKKSSHPQNYFISPFSSWLVLMIVFFQISLLLFLWQKEEGMTSESCIAIVYATQVFILLNITSFYSLFPAKSQVGFLLLCLFFSSFLLMASQNPVQIKAFLTLEAALLLYTCTLIAFLSLFSFLPQPWCSFIHFVLSQALLFAPFYFHYFLPLVSEPEKWLPTLLWLQPLPLGLEKLFGWDFYRFRWMYDFSSVSDYIYQYPSLKEWVFFLGKSLLVFLFIKTFFTTFPILWNKVKDYGKKWGTRKQTI